MASPSFFVGCQAKKKNKYFETKKTIEGKEKRRLGRKEERGEKKKGKKGRGTTPQLRNQRTNIKEELPNFPP